MAGGETPRRKARRIALQGAYSLGEDLIGDLREGVDSAIEARLSDGLGDDQHSQGLLNELVSSFNERREDAMALLDGQMEVPLEDMPMIDRIALVLATVEMLSCPNTPQAVVINEWIELSKEFGSENGFRLVNAILDSVRVKI